MSKVVTSAGLNDFIESGKTEDMKKPEKVEKVEAKTEIEAKTEDKETPVEADGDLMPEETLEQARAKIAKKHRELKAEKALRTRLQDERDENERLAESQFNERRLVESERDGLRRQLDELKARAAPEKPREEVKPPSKEDRRFFNEKGEFQWELFTQAQSDFTLEKYKQEQQAERAAQTNKELEAKVAAKVEVAKAKYPDFVEKLQAQAERKDVPPYIMQFLYESDQGADIAYYFADNREELTKLSKLSPIMALARLGKLETRFEPKAEKVEEKVEPKADAVSTARTSSAPPPITPITGQGSGTVTTDPSKMDFRQLRAYEREKSKRKG